MHSAGSARIAIDSDSLVARGSWSNCESSGTKPDHTHFYTHHRVLLSHSPPHLGGTLLSRCALDNTPPRCLSIHNTRAMAIDSTQVAGPPSLPLPEFSASFPLPFRVLFLVGLAILLWAVNLHILTILGIDVSWALDIRDGDDERAHGNSIELDDSHSPSRQPVNHVPSAHLYGAVYKCALVYSLWCIAGWGAFRFITGDDTDSMENWRGVAGLVCLIPIIAAVAPWRGFAYRERRALRQALWRCINPPAGEPIFFCDVILADILTSFAKVLGDLYVSTSQIMFSGISHGRVAPHGVTKFIVLGMVCLPYIIRFRQCMVEFYHSGWTSMRPFANALKYASAFPVIFLSAAQKTVVHDVAASKGMTVDELGLSGERWFGEHRLFRLWLLSVAINSIFSFYWDVEKDWGLSLLELDTWFPSRSSRDGGYITPTGYGRSASLSGSALWARLSSLGQRDNSHQRSPVPTPAYDLGPPSPPSSRKIGGAHWGLRPILLLPDAGVYYLFTVLDLVLRFTWSLELSSHLHIISDIESGVFLMEALELVRRWMWVFIRVEWEVVRMSETSKLRGPSQVERTAVLWEDKGNEDR